ncbi:uncharacterized protein BJ171DRAFT_505095 [Polychytrium aggregatum]|uniref:uncharacterized protein n=1 Tax=Polychytrium aggregatum TaxID=110093 RepID=UPI0022FE969B|nr:uncharacterized protein BJ171DRAFT_505095 [Polychytrium aggregatum]KAI9204687.1 hypothetical protein BJ171DRAFT_505095 [Polychytrium aggregatum]
MANHIKSRRPSLTCLPSPSKAIHKALTAPCPSSSISPLSVLSAMDVASHPTDTAGAQPKCTPPSFFDRKFKQLLSRLRKNQDPRHPHHDHTFVSRSPQSATAAPRRERRKSEVWSIKKELIGANPTRRASIGTNDTLVDRFGFIEDPHPRYHPPPHPQLASLVSPMPGPFPDMDSTFCSSPSDCVSPVPVTLWSHKDGLGVPVNVTESNFPTFEELLVNDRTLKVSLTPKFAKTESEIQQLASATPSPVMSVTELPPSKPRWRKQPSQRNLRSPTPSLRSVSSTLEETSISFKY